MKRGDTRTPRHQDICSHKVTSKFELVVTCVLVSWCLGVLLSQPLAYALNIDKVKISYLSGDYKSAISEGEKILANAADSPDLDGLYYVLGLSYLKDGNYLRASDIFEIILKEFDRSEFKEEAKLGLGDTYFLRGEHDKAKSVYEGLLESGPETRLKPAIYSRLSQLLLDKGDTAGAQKYLDILKKDFPVNLETGLNRDLYSLTEIYYTVQVGSFTRPTNAKNLCGRLNKEGYEAYILETDSSGKKIYRVRVGKLKSKEEAVRLEGKLASKGYPTKIFP